MTDHLDHLICEYLRQYDGQAVNNEGLLHFVDGKWRVIDARIQAMRKSGLIKWHGRSRNSYPEGVREVLV